jgi:hypothetical protein
MSHILVFNHLFGCITFARMASSAYQKWPFYTWCMTFTHTQPVLFTKNGPSIYPNTTTTTWGGIWTRHNRHITYNRHITCNNIDHMCIKNHTHCSVESVVERRHQPLHCRQSVNRSMGCRILKHHTCLPRTSEDRGTPFRDGLKTWGSKTSTDQHIIYNTDYPKTPPDQISITSVLPQE